MGCSVRTGTALGGSETFAADIRSCPPARSLHLTLLPLPSGAAEHSWRNVYGGCGSQKALKETGCSAATGLMDTEETTRKQT